MAQTASTCEYETERVEEPFIDDDDLLYSIDLLDCSSLSSSDFALDDLAFDCNEASPSASSSDTSSAKSMTVEGIDNILRRESKINLLPKNIEQGQLSKTGSKSVMKKGQRYLPSFKRKVLNYAVKHSFRETARKFHINCNTLTEWAREYKRLLLLKKSTTTRPGISVKTDESGNLLKTDQTDPRTQFPHANLKSEVEFLQWLKKKRLEGYRLGRRELQITGLTILQSDCSTSQWFITWVNRLVALGDEKSKPGARKHEKHINYPDSFRLEVALYGEMYTKPEAARTFGVSSRRVYEWCDRMDKPKGDSALTQVEQKLLLWYQGKCADGSRPKCLEIMAKARVFYAECGLPHVKCSQGWLDKVRKRLDLKLSHAGDDDLLLWILAQLDNNSSLSLMQVTNKARELAISSGDKDFKGSKGWTLRFLKRHSHLLQCSSAKLSDLPPVAAARAQSFCLTLQQRVGAASLEPASIGCMDEVPISFVYPTETVPTPPLLRKANLEHAHAVILLAATSDGRLLPPAVVLKGTRAIQTFIIEKTTIVVLRHDTGAVDQETLVDWARHVWFQNVRAPSMLVVDSFTPHLKEQLKEELSTGYCKLAVIPPGCAVHLQPCAFNLSRRFQEVIQEEWLKYTATSCFPLWRTKVGPDDEAILNWVARAYLALREDAYSIRCSFHLTGLTKPADQAKSSELVT